MLNLVEQSVLERSEAFLRTEVAPRSIAIDQDVEALRSAFDGLAREKLLALRLPKHWGGLGLSAQQYGAFQESIARFSGALAFLQTQHQSAGSLLAKSENEALKEEFLPFMATGEKRVGIGFSHLRRENNPPLKAIETSEGYLLQGHAPWLTGFEIFQHVLIAATLADGRAVYGIAPFSPTSGIEFSEPMAMSAMSSTNTVTAEFTNWLLPIDRVAFSLPAGAIHQSDRANVLNASFFVLGCAQAAIDVIESVRQQKPFLAIANAQATLQQELSACRQAIYAAIDQPYDVQLNLRSSAIALSVRCAHAAIVVSSGAANSTTHPAQRIYREALVFSVSGQTIALLEASLKAIVRSEAIDI